MKFYVFAFMCLITRWLVHQLEMERTLYFEHPVPLQVFLDLKTIRGQHTWIDFCVWFQWVLKNHSFTESRVLLNHVKEAFPDSVPSVCQLLNYWWWLKWCTQTVSLPKPTPWPPYNVDEVDRWHAPSVQPSFPRPLDVTNPNRPGTRVLWRV